MLKLTRRKLIIDVMLFMGHLITKEVGTSMRREINVAPCFSQHVHLLKS